VVVKVLYFASFRESLGRDEEERVLPSGAKVGDLWKVLGRESPPLAAFGAMPPAAVNRAYAGAETVLAEGDEVVFLPPVAGG
jgi:molybdopterin converting factor subunit 1